MKTCLFALIMTLLRHVNDVISADENEDNPGTVENSSKGSCTSSFRCTKITALDVKEVMLYAMSARLAEAPSLPLYGHT